VPLEAPEGPLVLALEVLAAKSSVANDPVPVVAAYAVWVMAGNVTNPTAAIAAIIVTFQLLVFSLQSVSNFSNIRG
jgi:hypothetical protein